VVGGVRNRTKVYRKNYQADKEKKVMEKERRCSEKAEEENRPLVGERASWRGLNML
jgi:hypothetical protein